jgi:hypothetical protein
MTQAEQTDLITTFGRFQKRKEAYWSPKIYKALQKQVKAFIATYSIRPASSALLMVEALPVYDVLKDLYLDVGVTWGAKTYADITKDIRSKARMPIGLSEFLIAEMLRYYEVDLLNDVQNITETTRQNILEALRQSVLLGLGVEDTIKFITDNAIPTWRARLIARTECVTAANKAADLSASKTGLLMSKTWIAAKDSRTRKDHVEVNGKVVNKSEPFIVGGFKMMQPGDRGTASNPTPAKEICNCRCAVGYRAKRDANGRLIRLDQVNVALPTPNIRPTIQPIKPIVVEPVTPVKPAFKEAKTVKEAEDFARNVIGVKYVNFKGIDLAIANDINKSVFNVKSIMPDIKTVGIGSAQKANKDLKDEVLRAYKNTEYYKNIIQQYGQKNADYLAIRFANNEVSKLGPNTLAWSQNKDIVRLPGGNTLDVSKYTGVFVNEKFSKSKTQIDEIVKSNRNTKWFTESAEDFGYVMHHEIGHEIDKAIGFRSLKEFQVIYDREHAKGIQHVIDNLSKYGATAGGNAAHKKDEMIAEAWAEFMTSKNPRPLATEIGELMLETYYKKYVQGTGITFNAWKDNALKIIR